MFKIILITPEQDHPEESRIIEDIVRNYPIGIHIRKPFHSIEEYRNYLKLYTSEQIINRFVLHEHHELASEFPVKGIHLKEKDRMLETTRDQSDKIISTSIHVIPDEFGLEDMYSYVFFSPLFESISKQQYGRNMTEEELKYKVFEFKKNSSVALIGLGGINEENIIQIKQSGFDGAALVGAIWNNNDPFKAFEQIYSKVL